MTTDDGKKLHAKALKDLTKGEVIHINLPGGGGYGDPFKRDPDKVLWDVIEGYVTANEAEKELVCRYGADGGVAANGECETLGSRIEDCGW